MKEINLTASELNTILTSLSIAQERTHESLPGRKRMDDLFVKIEIIAKEEIYQPTPKLSAEEWTDLISNKRLIQKLGQCYRRSNESRTVIATLCDEYLDKSGELLGKVRGYDTQETQPTKMSAEEITVISNVICELSSIHVYLDKVPDSFTDKAISLSLELLRTILHNHED